MKKTPTKNPTQEPDSDPAKAIASLRLAAVAWSHERLAALAQHLEAVNALLPHLPLAGQAGVLATAELALAELRGLVAGVQAVASPPTPMPEGALAVPKT